MIPLSYNVRSILRRRFTAVATAAGLGLVVFVWAAVLMLSAGVEQTLRSTGSRQNAILIRKGASTELTSFLARDAAKMFSADNAVAIEGGKAVASPELFVIQQLERSDGGGPANVAFRGITKDGYELLRKGSVRIIEGRYPQPGTSEVMIGTGARGRYVGAQLGSSINKARRQWSVVGVFDAHGSAFESEIWADVEQIAQAMNRTGYSSLTVHLKDPSDFAALKAAVDADPQFNLEAKREDAYYEESSGQLASFITYLGGVIAWMFAFGATLGAMITMYAQVATRVREVGTLRALGFQRGAVLFSFLVESLILSGLGAVVGCACAVLLTRLSFTTINFSSFTEIKFHFTFSAAIAAKAIFFAVVMGLLGGLLPALRAARLPIAEATKG